MKDRQKKKAEKRKRELIHQILDMALDINGLEPREQKITGKLPTAFLRFSGHVASVEVGVHKSGWDRGSDADKNVECHTYQTQELEAAIRKLEAIKAETPTAGTVGESR